MSKEESKVIIINSSSNLYFQNLTPKIHELLDNALSYRILGSEHSTKYKNGEWDGKKHLYKKNRTRSGFLDRVRELFHTHGIVYEVVETGNYNKKFWTRIDFNRSWNIELWPHQIEALKIATKKAQGIIEIATGGGKSVLMASIIHELSLSANVFIDSVDVGRQLHKTLSDCLGEENVGFVGDSLCEIVTKKVNVILLPTAYLSLLATHQLKKWKITTNKDGSVEYKLEKILLSGEKYELISECIRGANVSIYDECDRLGASTYSAVSSCTNSFYNYGFSATPWRNDGKDLEIEGGVGRKIYQLGATELIKRGILVTPHIQIFKILWSIDRIPKRYPSIFKTCIVENEYRNMLIADLTKDQVKTGKIGLISVNRLAHGRELKKLLVERGIKAEFLCAKNSSISREKAIRRLREKELSVIISTLFGRGTDIPELDFLIRAKGEGMSKTGKPNSDVLQLVGRAIRKSENKVGALIIDFFDPYPIVNTHSQSRIDTYQSEEGFKVYFYDSTAYYGNKGIIIRRKELKKRGGE